MAEVVIGIEELKNRFRRAKLKCGDLRGLKNAFALSTKLGVPAIGTYLYKSGLNGEKRAELTADCYSQTSDRSIHAYTMGGLVEDIKDETEVYEITLVCLLWNKQRCDAERKDIDSFTYSNS